MRGMSLQGRTAVVTGGAGAIGGAICRDLASLGAHVIVADIDGSAAAATAAALTGAFPDPAAAEPGAPGARARHLTVDLADPASIEEFCARAGPVDILVHNAGVSIVEPFVTSDPEHWDLMWRVNLRAPMLLTKLLLPGMTGRGWGRLVFVSSDGARAGSGGEGAYAATKAGLFGLAKTLAREAARGNVTSNVVCPGPTDTPMLRRVDAEKPGLVDKIAKGIPLRRLGAPEDVAGLVAYLCTDRAAYVTGQTLSVSGGVTMH
ncbi:SDR family oxidoreductase [Planomonospora sp. ID67723]|uniref:SDR family NAD(P)-dependent oxidoreductase n=1 Tax=Planomonospora sp. ID67723 TaxID=2738134 RepID=UPI0018C3FA59|nr:SDR family NAD(P)-dependent oxidoreductase [Planomonospora sp. ID67723]MBG0828694.1 SDR family oxidoreductase [Planomonospora sp. ID67723]